jgi:hypothetical protein
VVIISQSIRREEYTIPGTVVPGWGGTEGLAWISSTIPPMITGLGSTTAWPLSGFCDKGEKKSIKERSKVGL